MFEKVSKEQQNVLKKNFSLDLTNVNFQQRIISASESKDSSDFKMSTVYTECDMKITRQNVKDNTVSNHDYFTS